MEFFHFPYFYAHTHIIMFFQYVSHISTTEMRTCVRIGNYDPVATIVNTLHRKVLYDSYTFSAIMTVCCFIAKERYGPTEKSREPCNEPPTRRM
jgi:hypothetical protein